MPKLKLYYFSVPGKALVTRLILYHAGIPFEDFRFKAADWDYKNKTPFGCVPILEVDGKQLCQSDAITNYVTRLANIDFKDIWLDAKVMEVINCCDDLNLQWGLTMRMEAEEKKQRRIMLYKDVLPDMLRRLDNIIGQNNTPGFAVSNRISAADFRVFSIVDVFKSNFVDGFPTDLADKYEHLIAIYDNVLKLPKVKEWMDRNESRG